jgi:hypothetical protein
MRGSAPGEVLAVDIALSFWLAGGNMVKSLDGPAAGCQWETGGAATVRACVHFIGAQDLLSPGP